MSFKFSILMNTYNCSAYINQAISSVINQSYHNWELIVFDNLSTDDTAVLVSKFEDSRIKYIKSDKHYSLGEARQIASQFLNGDLIAFLDSDDLWLPDHLHSHLIAHSDCSIVASYANSIFFDESHAKLAHKYPQTDYNNPDQLVSNYKIPLETCVINGPVFRDKCKGFSSKYSNIADFDLFYRASSLGRFKYINKTLAAWRVRSSSDTWSRYQLTYNERLEWLFSNGRHLSSTAYNIYKFNTFKTALIHASLDKSYCFSLQLIFKCPNLILDFIFFYAIFNLFCPSFLCKSFYYNRFWK